MTLEIEIGDRPLTFILMLKSNGVGGGWCTLDYSISSGPFLSYKLRLDMDPSLTITNILTFEPFSILDINVS